MEPAKKHSALNWDHRQWAVYGAMTMIQEYLQQRMELLTYQIDNPTTDRASRDQKQYALNELILFGDLCDPEDMATLFED